MNGVGEDLRRTIVKYLTRGERHAIVALSCPICNPPENYIMYIVGDPWGISNAIDKNINYSVASDWQSTIDNKLHYSKKNTVVFTDYDPKKTTIDFKKFFDRTVIVSGNKVPKETDGIDFMVSLENPHICKIKNMKTGEIIHHPIPIPPKT